MAEKFHNKYRIQSARLQYWDYGWNAFYFVTICTKNRKCYFGEIRKRIVDEPLRVSLSEIGKIAEQYWINIPEHFPFVNLGEFVIMPNHVHGIIIIDKPVDVRNDVETQNFASLHSQQRTNEQKNKFGPQSKNLASIIRGFKSGVKKYATINNIDFAWQSRFYDHIIRDEKSFQNISNYIIKNPSNWMDDSFYNQ